MPKVKVPENHIVIDFDLADKKGIHLHYLYSGNVKKLSSFYDEHLKEKEDAKN